MKPIKAIFLLLFFCNFTIAQTSFSLKGIFPQATNKEILLKGYTMSSDTLLAKTTTDEKGSFWVQYPSNYTGAALLEIKDTKSVIVLLNHENFEMQWDNLEEFKTLQFKNSPENDAFGNGIAVVQKSESLLSGLKYLKPLYEKEEQNQKNTKKNSKSQWINDEIAFQEKAFSGFLDVLPATSYAKYYLNLRKFLQDMPLTASRYIERMPNHEKQFNSLDFADKKLLHSGLYKELLDAYFLLMESYGNLDTVSLHVNASVDALLQSLQKEPILKQDAAEYLFRLFEKRSLFKPAEHIALSMLNAENCQMDSKHAALFEQYRKMAKGNTAPEIVFENATKAVAKLSDIKSKYKLVVFGASWCEKCKEEIPKLKPFFEDWKTKYNLEIVFISLDTEPAKFNDFIKDFPWLSSCEFKGWESKAATDYCVFGTPTMYLLDAGQKILVKPISEKQVQAWMDMLEKK